MGGSHPFAIAPEVPHKYTPLQTRNRPGHLRGDRKGECEVRIRNQCRGCPSVVDFPEARIRSPHHFLRQFCCLNALLRRTDLDRSLALEMRTDLVLGVKSVPPDSPPPSKATSYFVRLISKWCWLVYSHTSDSTHLILTLPRPQHPEDLLAHPPFLPLCFPSPSHQSRYVRT